MSKSKTPSGLPNVVERRELLFGKESKKADHGRLAERYYAAGRLADALDFFFRSGNEAGIDGIVKDAVAGGEVFLLTQIERVTKRELERETWLEAGKNAEAADKLRFALQAFERAGDSDGVRRLGGEDEDEDE